MPNLNTPKSSRHTGFHRDLVNGRLEMYYLGTKVAEASAAAFAVTGALTATTSISATTAVSATTTVTAGTGLTVTTGNATVAAGDLRVTAGNARLGAVSAFATTEPTSWLVMKSGTQPSGAITTSGGIGANDTTVQKIVAGGTINNVETALIVGIGLGALAGFLRLIATDSFVQASTTLARISALVPF